MTALEPRKPQAPATGSKPGRDAAVYRIVDRLGPGRSMALGLVLAAAGVASAVVGVESLLVAVATSAAMTMGAGLFALGLHRLGGEDRPPALPGPRASRAVLDERARRIRRIMHEGGGAWTFELLQARLSWTERALAEALAYMRDRGEIVEDLDLETGKWVYRPSTGEVGEGASTDMTLDDRLRRLDAEG